jgi:6-phosphogluconolactonase
MDRTIVMTAVVSLAAFSVTSAKSISVYIGTYTGGGSRGIYRTTLDLDTGTLAEPVLAAEARNPSFVELHPSGKYLYAVSEGGGAGSVTAFAIDAARGDLKRLNQQPSSVIPIRPDGALGSPAGFVQHTGAGPNPGRQKGPHAHSVNVSPDDRFAFVADLGIDKIMIYKLDVDAGTIVANDPPFVSLAPGAGPRHFAFAPDGKHAYVINELNSTMTAFAYDSATGSLAEVQTVPTLPSDFGGASSCAEVRVPPERPVPLRLQSRPRQHCCPSRVDPAHGTLTFVEHEMPASRRRETSTSTRPAPSASSPTRTTTASSSFFRIDPQTGALEPTGRKISVGRPVCIRFR